MLLQVTNRRGGTAELVNVGVFDNTGETTLTLWEVASRSAPAWKPSHTVLLLSEPGYSDSGSRNTISLNAGTIVDVNPDVPETAWLRRFAENMTKTVHVNPAFPSEVFNPETVATGVTRALYTLADVGEQARSSSEPFSGYLSMIVLEMSLTKLHLGNMSMCAECCGIPMFASKAVAICKQCNTAVNLRPNPRIVGTVIDETGRIGSGQMIWSELAWEQLFGRKPDEVVTCAMETLRAIEQSLLYRRLTFVFGWSEQVGKVVVARVMT